MRIPDGQSKMKGDRPGAPSPGENSEPDGLAAAAARVAARAEAEAGFEPAVRALLASLCEELGLIGARALVQTEPERRVFWHVAEPASVRLLLEQVPPQVSGKPSALLASEAAVLASERRPPITVEAFAPPEQGCAQLSALCAGVGEVLDHKPLELDTGAGRPSPGDPRYGAAESSGARSRPEVDPLTGLASRPAFLRRLEASFQRTRALPGSTVALFSLDVDRFRRVNQGVGTAAGDALLVQLAARLREVVPPGALASRFGADEFLILLENVRDPGQVLRLAERLHLHLEKPITLEAMEISSTVSIGIAFAGQSSPSTQELLHEADAAMSSARAQGPGRTALWNSTMSRPTAARLRIESDLRGAVDRAELQVAYQPVISLGNGEITGLEALARWNHPTLGPVPPLVFVPVAEEVGLIERMGLAILREACQHMRALELGRRAPLTLSVNLSARQMLQPDLVEQMAGVIADSGVSPSLLRVEVTESMLVENREAAASALRRLREMQVQVFLDDFGTGYSSLSYLHDLPVDGVKIDRSFVVALRSGVRARSLVGSILGLARDLQLEVIAEGVETEEEGAALSALGCPAAQGFLFARPVPAAQARALLQRGAFFWRGPGS